MQLHTRRRKEIPSQIQLNASEHRIGGCRMKGLAQLLVLVLVHSITMLLPGRRRFWPSRCTFGLHILSLGTSLPFSRRGSFDWNVFFFALRVHVLVVSSLGLLGFLVTANKESIILVVFIFPTTAWSVI